MKKERKSRICAKSLPEEDHRCPRNIGRILWKRRKTSLILQIDEKPCYSIYCKWDLVSFQFPIWTDFSPKKMEGTRGLLISRLICNQELNWTVSNRCSRPCCIELRENNENRSNRRSDSVLVSNKDHLQYFRFLSTLAINFFLSRRERKNR